VRWRVTFTYKVFGGQLVSVTEATDQ